MKPKKELVRVVRSPEGEISLDLTGKKPGRGAYVCRDAACVKKLCKSRRLSHLLRGEIPGTIYEELRREVGLDG